MKHTQSTRRRIYRSRKNRVFFGVCGGIAEHLDFNPTALRFLAFILIASSGIGLLIYIGLGFAMKPAPELSFASTSEEDLYFAMRESPELAMRRIRERFERLDKRLQRMESIVTSRSFEVEQELRRL